MPLSRFVCRGNRPPAAPLTPKDTVGPYVRALIAMLAAHVGRRCRVAFVDIAAPDFCVARGGSKRRVMVGEPKEIRYRRAIRPVLEAIAKVERTLARHEAERRVERLDWITNMDSGARHCAALTLQPAFMATARRGRGGAPSHRQAPDPLRLGPGAVSFGFRDFIPLPHRAVSQSPMAGECEIVVDARSFSDQCAIVVPAVAALLMLLAI
jgi:hypothetical protein